MKNNQFKKNRRVESEYARNMWKMFNHFFSLVGDNVEEYLSSIRTKTADPFFVKWTNKVAGNMVKEANKENSEDWRTAARTGTNSAEVYNLLKGELKGKVGKCAQEIVEQNAKLIRSLPLEVAKIVNRQVQKETMAGKRFEASNILARVSAVTQSRIVLISRTETSKATTALTRARAEELDLNFYVWRSSEDVRVRLSHRKLDGVVVFWSEPPSPEALAGERSTLGHYHAGDAPNCRCYPEPVLALSDLRFPVKVYHEGMIQRMNRFQFVKLLPGYKVAA